MFDCLIMSECILNFKLLHVKKPVTFMQIKYANVYGKYIECYM